MLMSTTNEIFGYRLIRQIGLVHAITLRAGTGPEGREIRLGTLAPDHPHRDPYRYFELADNARQAVLERLEAAAKHVGANAVIGVRFGASGITGEFAEVLAYGTAVIVEATERERATPGFPTPQLKPPSRERAVETFIGEKEMEMA